MAYKPTYNIYNWGGHPVVIIPPWLALYQWYQPSCRGGLTDYGMIMINMIHKYGKVWYITVEYLWDNYDNWELETEDHTSWIIIIEDDNDNTIQSHIISQAFSNYDGIGWLVGMISGLIIITLLTIPIPY